MAIGNKSSGRTATSLRSCRSLGSRCASHYCGSRLPSHSAGLGSRRTQFKVQSNTRFLNVRVASQLGPAIANLRIGEAKPLGMATKQRLIHPNPDRHAPSLAAVQTDSACSSSEDDGTPTRSVKLASLEPMATRKSPTTTVADDV